MAVLGVMAFHAGLPGFSGGFLGVDVFFVLSGFLITTLLVREHRSKGTIALPAFYMRRTLRLLPALLGLVVFLQVWSQGFIFPEQVRQLHRETAATLLYVANWGVLAGVVSPLGFFGHAWSLAIEEQFYIVWPLTLRALLGRTSRTTMLALLAAAAAASALWRASMADDPDRFNRAFYGSDTRAEELLAGCFLAVLLQSPSTAAALGRSRLVPVLGGASALVLALMFSQAEWPAAWMLRGGFSVVTLSTALLLLTLQVSPEGVLARVLSWRPLVAIGSISYGLYLWQQPVILAISPRMFDLGALPIAVARFVVTFAMATLSWVLIERAALRWKRRWR